MNDLDTLSDLLTILGKQEQLLFILEEQQREIEALESENNALNSENENLLRQIDTLRKQTDELGNLQN